MASKSGSVDPSRYQDELFDLYSIPAFDKGHSEVVEGREIGSSKQIVYPGDVLLSKIVPHIRRAWVVQREQGHRIIASGEWIVFRSNRFNPRYLRHVLTSDSFHAQFMNTVAGVGGSLVRARPAFAAKIKIPLPPLAEQKWIADMLDKAEELRSKRRAALAQLDTLTQSIFLEMFGDPMANYKNWPVLAVGKAGLVQLGRQRAPKYQTGKHTRKYVRVANIYENRIDLSDVLSMDFDSKDFELYCLKHGDILLNEGQSTELVGRVAMWRNEISDCCFQNTLVRFQPDRKTTTPEFALAVFLHYYRSGEFAKISSKTSNVAHLGAGRFAAMPFPLPPLRMQEEFASRFKSVEKLKANQHASLAELDTLFASLQQKAFSGDL